MPLTVRYTDSEGQQFEVHPSKISAKISANAATEITLTFPDKSGLYSDVIVPKDMIEIEETP